MGTANARPPRGVSQAMSTLWTPHGERPIRRDPEPAPGPDAPPRSGDVRRRGEPSPTGEQLTEEQVRELVMEEQERLAAMPVEEVVAALAMELARLAAVHLSGPPSQVEKARTAIDAFGTLVEGMQGRLGEPEKQLVKVLAELRMSFVATRNAAPGQSG